MHDVIYHNQITPKIMRTIVEIEDNEAARLDAWAKSQNISRTEAVRRAVRQMLDQAALPKGEGFGLWSHALSPKRDGLVIQRELREEWPE
jgi:metal-responsive CopG/Arc/MetJ family transcriptional regulator